MCRKELEVKMQKKAAEEKVKPGKTKFRVQVCRWDEEELVWKLKTVPSHAAAKQVERGNAVYPVDGSCPVDPPVEVEEEEAEEA